MNEYYLFFCIPLALFATYFLIVSLFELLSRIDFSLKLKRKWGMLLDENGTLINEEKLRVYEAWQQKAISFSLFLSLTLSCCGCAILAYAGHYYYLTLLFGIFFVICLGRAIFFGREMESCRKSGCERYPDMDGEKALPEN